MGREMRRSREGAWRSWRQRGLLWPGGCGGTRDGGKRLRADPAYPPHRSVATVVPPEHRPSTETPEGQALSGIAGVASLSLP